MPCQRLEPADLLRRVDPDSLGFTSTQELIAQPLPWIGQPRAEAAARFGLGMALPGYNLLVVGEVGTGRTTLMRQLMRHHAATCPVPPDLLYLHHVAQPERPLALRLPAGEGRQLRQAMVQLAKRLQTDIPRRLAEPDVKAESERIEQAYKSEESRAYAELNAYAQAGLNAFAMEFMPRITRAQSMDVLSSQANLAGYRSVIDAAAEYGRSFPMMMTAAGTKPATNNATADVLVTWLMTIMKMAGGTSMPMAVPAAIREAESSFL